MPVMTVRLAEGASAEAKCALLSGLRSALLEAYAIGDGGCYALLEEYPADRLHFPQGEAGAVMVEVRCFPGRSAEQKERFFVLAARAAEDAGFDAQTLLVLVEEPPLENWGLMGGTSAARIPGLGAAAKQDV